LSETRSDVSKETPRQAADKPNNADLRRKGMRHASGADTPSGPDTDRKPRRALEEAQDLEPGAPAAPRST
jgi:hypothetical protein